MCAFGVLRSRNAVVTDRADGGRRRFEVSGIEWAAERRAGRRGIRRRGRRARADKIHRRRREKAAAAEIARRRPDPAASRVVHDSVAAAQHHRLRELPRKAEPRRDVVAIGIRLIPRAAVAPDQPHDALAARQRIGCVLVEERQLIVLLDPWRLIVVTHAKVHGQPVRHLPVILHVRRKITLRRQEPRIARDLTSSRLAEQKRRKSKTAVRRRDGRIRTLRKSRYRRRY